MKNITLFLVAILLANFAYSQSPEKMSYQAIVRDGNNEIVINSVIGIQIRILKGTTSGEAVYTERHSPTTNFNGLISIEIGTGTIINGIFTNIDWSNGPFYLETSIDISGGTNYSGYGISQLMSVPYALYAKSAGNCHGSSVGNTYGDMQFWNGNSWEMIPAGQNGQNLTMCNGKPIWGPCPEPPTITLNSISSIFKTHLNANASITSSGTNSITNKGFVWSLYPNPSLEGLSISVSTEEDNFETIITGLNAGCTYYIKAFAQSSAGTGYSNEISATMIGDSISFVYKDETVTYGTIEYNDRIWLDRNLGANRKATSYNDSQSYGDLFQWGRTSDLHQNRNSTTTSNLSTENEQPNSQDFILSTSSPYDWNSNNAWVNRWTDANGIKTSNDPCPNGWRIPTSEEWNSIDTFGNLNNRTDAFNNPLRLPSAGFRINSNGSIQLAGSTGYYWSSSSNETNSFSLVFNSSDSYIGSNTRSKGFSVRCIKE